MVTASLFLVKMVKRKKILSKPINILLTFLKVQKVLCGIDVPILVGHVFYCNTERKSHITSSFYWVFIDQAVYCSKILLIAKRYDISGFLEIHRINLFNFEVYTIDLVRLMFGFLCQLIGEIGFQVIINVVIVV